MKTEYNLLPSPIPCRIGSLREHGHRAVIVEVNGQPEILGDVVTPESLATLGPVAIVGEIVCYTGERKWIEALMALASNGSGLAVTPVPHNWPAIRDKVKNSTSSSSTSNHHE